MTLSIEISLVKNWLLSKVTKLQIRKIPKEISKLFIANLSLQPFFYIFTIGYVILSMQLPVSIYTGLIHDDALYWGNARLIVEGHWLGEFSQMTLAKGPGFPLFLAVNALIGTPVTLAITLFYLFSCYLIVNTLGALGLSRYSVLILFIIILFHPELFPLRIIRDDIYPALSLIILSGVIRLVIAPEPQDSRLTNVIPYGLVFGLFWVTREEGIWIIPGILLMILLKVFQLKKQNLPIKDIFIRFACFSMVAILFISLIGFINYHKYGKFEVVDFKGQAYSEAIKGLNSVDVGNDLPYLPVSFEKRQAIYKVSPSFAQLKDYFEDDGKGWTKYGCSFYSWTCGDYAGGFFQWALREAAANKGYYQTPLRAAEFYNNITKEIQKACDSGVIKCKTNPVPFMPNISMEQWWQFPEKITDAIKLAMVQLPIPANGGPSWEPLEQLQRVRLFLGNPRTINAPSEQSTELKGWFYSTSSDWITLNCSINGTTVKKEIDRIVSPDIAQNFNNPNANFQRFLINISDNEDCSIATNSSPSNILPIKLILEKQEAVHNIGETGSLHIDQVSHSYTYSEKYIPFKIKNILGNIYKIMMPIIALSGAFVYLAYLIFILIRKILITDILIVSTLMWCLFISRILLLVLVDISSFPAINETYMSAAFPILCMAAFLSLQLVFSKNIKPPVCIIT